MTTQEEIKQSLQKAITIGNQLRDLEKSESYGFYKEWLDKSIETRLKSLPDKYAKLTDKEYGVQVGIVIGLREALEYPTIQIAKAEEAVKKIGEIADGKR